MNNKVSFPEYYSAIGKPITNGEVCSLNDSNVKILKCDENEYIDIKPEYKILGAYVFYLSHLIIIIIISYSQIVLVVRFKLWVTLSLPLYFPSVCVILIMDL